MIPETGRVSCGVLPCAVRTNEPDRGKSILVGSAYERLPVGRLAGDLARRGRGRGGSADLLEGGQGAALGGLVGDADGAADGAGVGAVVRLDDQALHAEERRTAVLGVVHAAAD